MNPPRIKVGELCFVRYCQLRATFVVVYRYLISIGFYFIWAGVVKRYFAINEVSFSFQRNFVDTSTLRVEEPAHSADPERLRCRHYAAHLFGRHTLSIFHLSLTKFLIYLILLFEFPYLRIKNPYFAAARAKIN